MFFWGLKKRKAMGPPPKKNTCSNLKLNLVALQLEKLQRFVSESQNESWHILAIYKDLKYPHEPNRHLLKMGNCFPQVRLVFHAQDTERCAASDGASVAGDID